MSFTVFHHLKSKAGQFAFNSPLYNWSLKGDVPDRLCMKPVDVWPGDPEAGRRLSEGVFSLGNEELALRGPCWEPFGVDEAWMAHMHGFSWLRDLPAYAYQSGQHDAVRDQARMMILAWIDRYKSWKALSWRADILGERIAMWISLYEFYSRDRMDEPDDEEFHDLFFDSLARQARHLSRSLTASELGGGLHGPAILKAAKGLLYAGLALEGRGAWAEQALEVFEAEIARQVLGDGAHVSRAADQLLAVLQILLDVRSAMCTAGLPLPEAVQHAIDKMAPALRFYRYHDKHFGAFHGVQEGNKAFVDCVLAQTGVKGKATESLPCAGFERVQAGRTFLMFDCGGPSARPYDLRAHAAALAFEMGYAKERIFVNCGTHPYDPAWQDALRGTAAHNTLGLDHRNAYEIGAGGHFGRKARKVQARREDCAQGHLLDASHDGYEMLNGMVHRRRLFLSTDGSDLRGEDSLQSDAVPVRPIYAAVRFHLHPSVRVSLIGDGHEALLRLPSGVGWRFKHEGGRLALEESLYLGEGSEPRKTKQLAIYGQISDQYAQIKWNLCKEG